MQLAKIKKVGMGPHNLANCLSDNQRAHCPSSLLSLSVQGGLLTLMGYFEFEYESDSLFHKNNLILDGHVRLLESSVLPSEGRGKFCRTCLYTSLIWSMFDSLERSRFDHSSSRVSVGEQVTLL